MSEPGTATVMRREDGTLLVAHADKTIAVHRSVLEQMLPGHLHENGDIQLDFTIAGADGLQFAYTCDNCQSSHWLTITPAALNTTTEEQP